MTQQEINRKYGITGKIKPNIDHKAATDTRTTKQKTEKILSELPITFKVLQTL